MVDFETPAYCPVCGADSPESGRYCSECGSDLLGETARAPAEPPADGVHAEGSESTLVTRRRVLLGGGVIITGTLLGLGALSTPSHQIYGEGWDVDRSTTATSVTLEGTVSIPEGRYAVRIFEPDARVEYSLDFDVVAGGPIDVFFLEDAEYERYRDRNADFQVRDSRLNTQAGELTATVGDGDYKLIIDNTGVFGASPDGDVDVSITLTATPA